MPTTKPTKSGFSLIELSVVVLIIGILIYMTLAAGAQQLEVARIKQTQFKLQKIQTALAMYLKTYGHLPCPANGSVANNNPAYGTQLGYSNLTSAYGDAQCDKTTLLTDQLVPNLYVGVVPTRDLGMSNDSMTDGWGNRITYIVSSSCIDPDDWNNSFKFKCGFYNPLGPSFSSTANGGRVVLQDQYNNTFPSNSNAAYITISHGTSGYGAWPGDGGASRIGANGATNISAAEYTNGNLDSTTGNVKFTVGASPTYYDAPIRDGDINYFDNIILWSTASQLYYNSNH